MSKNNIHEAIGRRRFLGIAAMSIAAAEQAPQAFAKAIVDVDAY